MSTATKLLVLFPIAVLAYGRDHFRLKNGRDNLVGMDGTRQTESARRSNDIAGEMIREILEDEMLPRCMSMSLPAPHKPSKTKKTSSPPSVVLENPPTIAPMIAVTNPVTPLGTSQPSSSTGSPSTAALGSSETPSVSPQSSQSPNEVKGKSKVPVTTSTPSSTLPSETTGSPVPPLLAPTMAPSENPATIVQPPVNQPTEPSQAPINQPLVPSRPPLDQMSPPPVEQSLVPSPQPADPSPAPSQPSSNDSTLSPALGSAAPSENPNSSPSTNLIPENDAFGCQPEGSNELFNPPTMFTTIAFKVTYQVDSLAPLVEYQKEMEAKILEIAVAGALQCNIRALVATNMTRANVLVNTTNFGDACVEPATSCVLLVTAFNATVDEDLDPDVASFLGYVMLRDEMDGGSFSEEIQVIDGMKYTGPLPLLPPVVNDDEVNQEPVQDIQTSDRVSVSPWALGAVSVASVGGLVALIVWLRSRVTQNRRHMELVEDMSVGSPSQA